MPSIFIFLLFYLIPLLGSWALLPVALVSQHSQHGASQGHHRDHVGALAGGFLGGSGPLLVVSI